MIHYFKKIERRQNSHNGPGQKFNNFFSFYDGDDLVQGTKTIDVEKFQHHLNVQNYTRIDTSNPTFGDVVSDFNYFPSTVDSNAIDRRNLALQQCDALFKNLWKITLCI